MHRRIRTTNRTAGSRVRPVVRWRPTTAAASAGTARTAKKVPHSSFNSFVYCCFFFENWLFTWSWNAIMVCVCVPVLVPFHQLRFDRFLSCRRSLLAFVDWPWRRHRRHLALKKRTVWPLSGAAVGGPLKFDAMNDGGFLSLPPLPPWKPYGIYFRRMFDEIRLFRIESRLCNWIEMRRKSHVM